MNFGPPTLGGQVPYIPGPGLHPPLQEIADHPNLLRKDLTNLGEGLLNGLTFGVSSSLGVSAGSGPMASIGDALGIGASLFLDPADLAFAGVSAAGRAARLSKIRGAVTDFTKAGWSAGKIRKYLTSKGATIFSASRVAAAKAATAAARRFQQSASRVKQLRSIREGMPTIGIQLIRRGSGKVAKKPTGVVPEDEVALLEKEDPGFHPLEVSHHPEPDEHGYVPGSHLAVVFIRKKCCAKAEHHGIYVGHGKVVHHDGEGHVSEIPLSSFHSGRDIRVVNSPVKGTLRDVKHRALRQVGAPRKYSLLRNNCEHFANECRSGKMVSHQIRKRVAATAGLSATAIGLGVGLGLRPSATSGTLSDHMTPSPPVPPIPGPTPGPTPGPGPRPDPPIPVQSLGSGLYWRKRHGHWELV